MSKGGIGRNGEDLTLGECKVVKEPSHLGLCKVRCNSKYTQRALKLCGLRYMQVTSNVLGELYYGLPMEIIDHMNRDINS